MNEDEMRELLGKVDILIEEILPQAGRLVFQDYRLLNEVCMGLTEFKKTTVTESQVLKVMEDMADPFSTEK